MQSEIVLFINMYFAFLNKYLSFICYSHAKFILDLLFVYCVRIFIYILAFVLNTSKVKLFYSLIFILHFKINILALFAIFMLNS